MSIEEAGSLPFGWRWAKLGDLCEIVIGRTPRRDNPSYWGGDNLWVSIGDLREGQITNTKEMITEEGVKASRSRLIKAGTLLFSFKLTIGKMSIAGKDLYTNEAIAGLIPYSDKEVTTDFLRFALMATNVYDGSSHAVKGKTLNQDSLLKIKIPIPSISEQKRIVEFLTEQMATVHKAWAAADERLKAAKNLSAAYLREIFGSEEAEGWPRRKVRDLLVSPLNTGISKPASPSSDIECLSLSAVRNGVLDLAARKPVAVTPKEAKTNWVKPGAFYVVRGNGNLSLVGRGALAPDPIVERVLYPDLLIEVNPNQEVLTPHYLSAVWNTDEVRKQIEKVARTSAGIHKINLQNLGNISIPVPRLDQQSQIADLVRERISKTIVISDKIAEERATIKGLSTALLRVAFLGGL